MTTIVGLVVALVFITPPGQKTVTFYTDDAASIQPGETVRVAGVIVGKVDSLAIEPNQVRVRAKVDRAVFIGDQSQVEVRMLTVVGGYFVTIVPLGNSPLGTRAIPLERVTMPYSLIRTLADATKITEHVATKPINENLNQLQQGLTDANAQVVTELVKAGNGITGTLERQRGQLSQILSISDEYINQISNNRELLAELVRKAAILEQTLVLYGKGFSVAFDGMGELGKRLTPVADFYMNHRSDFLERTRGILQEFQTIADRNGLVVRVLRRIRVRMERALDAQNASGPPELLATDLCIPIEGSPC